MANSIQVQNPLVVLHGDEMAQVAFDEILKRFVTARLDIDLIEIDLSAEKRFTSNGKVIQEAIEVLKTHGVGIKNAGMTVNRAQLDELLAQHPDIDEASLDGLATKSPNGAIRKGISGNITREDIEFRNLKSVRPNWIDRDIEVDTMETGGLDFSYSELSNATGVAKVMFVGSSGDPVELHRRSLNKGDPWMLATNCLEEVEAWAHRFFQRAIDEKRDIYLGLKDTVVSGYDGVMRAAIETIYERDYETKVAEAGLSYHYELIDAQAARVVSNPPERALWGIPDNVSGMKLFKLVQQLKRYGLPERKAHVSISRMSAGGGDQYGSYNSPAPEKGVIKVIVDGEEKHARHVDEGDPILFMSNDREAIKDWVSQVFQDAALNKKEVYFGLKREFVNYDEVYSSIILEIRKELAALDTPPPSFMIMRPSRQLSKMICDPPRWGLYP
ncbi:MAG: 3-isopropylmalate dehydrogenase, partial [Luminiphilus sp.]|nr:3-isopropylmalate dehydrogenase [Luminiphilus sp.]